MFRFCIVWQDITSVSFAPTVGRILAKADIIKLAGRLKKIWKTGRFIDCRKEVIMGVLECGGMAINGFWDNFGMEEAEVVWERVQEAPMPDAVICDAGKHLIDPRLEQSWVMGNVASAICRAYELTTEAREAFGDPSLLYWREDCFDRRIIEMAQEALAKADVSQEVRKYCEDRLADALFYLENAEWVAQEVMESL